MLLLCTGLIGLDRDAGRARHEGSGPLEVVHMGRKEPARLREALESGDHESRILCWNCRRMTPVGADRCESCGSPMSRASSDPRRPFSRANLPDASDDAELAEARRTLLDLFEDLQRVSDVSARPAVETAEEPGSAILFQCPSCGRFVAEDAVLCACGARFAAGTPDLQVQYECPRCGTHVSAEAASCVCGARFAD